MSTTNIYILRLEGGRYYVGKSEDIKSRVEQHMKGNGSAWTKKYKALALHKLIKNVSPFQEDSITKEYMSKYGIDKVRGGSYTQIILDTAQREAIEREIIGAKDACQQCGEKGHFIRYCPNKNKLISQAEEYDVEWGCEYCDRTFTTKFGCTVHEKVCKKTKVTNHYVKQTTKKGNACYRCGRSGHYSPDCYARTHSMGYTLDSDSDDDSD